MKQRKYLRMGWSALLTALLTLLFVPPASASSRSAPLAASAATTSINANVYLQAAMLQPIFQTRINQQVPGAVNNAISSIVSKLPASQRGWASQMAATLIQPSATLQSLTTRQDGFVITIRVSLYPGDPHPITANLLVKLSVLDSSTIQVSAQPINGSPALVNGPLMTMQIPFGQLNAINAAPSCGDAALVANLRFPITLGQAATQGQQVVANTYTGMNDIQIPTTSQVESVAAAPGTTSYVEIPASSLISLGASIGTMPIGNNLTAQNIHITVQSSQLVITSDVALGGSLVLGKATTYVQPVAASGNLAVHVAKTTLTVFSIFTFPYDTYNKQIEQTLNAKLNGALSGKFTVASAAIGANSHIPCAAHDSLILTGTTNIL